MKSHLLAYLQPDLAASRSTLGAEIKDINQSIGRTTLLIYNYCQGNCRWYLMIIRYFLKLRPQTRAICVKVFYSSLSREKAWTENYWKTCWTVTDAEPSDLLYTTGVKLP